MSDTQQFPNLPQSTWSCWNANLAQVLESNGCDSIQFSGGNSGTLAFHHKVPLSGGRFAFTYGYEPSNSVLTITVTEKPFDVSAPRIFSYIEKLAYDCPG